MKEIRTAQIRTDSADEGLTLVGTPIVFDTPTMIHDIFGDYTEIIKRSALADTDLNDTHLLYNHDLNKVPLARTPKTMKLEKTPNGINMRASLPETETGKEIYAAVKRQDLSGMSFAFKVPKGGDEYDAETNTRTINKIEKLYEVSLTPFPAYPQTSVEARSQIEGTWNKLKDPKRKELKIKVNQILKRGM